MILNGRSIPWRSLDELIRDKAHQHTDRVFTEIDGTQLSFNDLERQSRCIAGNLRALGLRPGDRVATLLFNCPEQILIWFGCNRGGLVWVPLNAGLTGDDLTYSLLNSGARVLVVDAECRPKVDAIRDRLGSIEIFTAQDPQAARPYSLLLTDSALPALDEQEAAEHPSAVLYTGGTTGLPKGVVLSQLSFILSGIRYGETFNVRAGERHYSTMPLFHSGGLQWAIMGPLVNDMSSVVDRRFSASRYFERVRQTGANIIDPFGAVVTMLCNQPPNSADREHKVRIAVGAVHGLPPHIPETFISRYGIPLVSMYGLTEAGGAMLTANREGQSLANGKAHGWVELRIGDENDQPVAVGDSGEILLRPTYPDMFMRGYLGDPEKTLAAMRNCWLHTGDLGRLDADGNLYFMGRQAHWIRRRGESISAVEIEMIVGKHAGVRDIAVIGVPSELGEDDIKAFIIAEDGAALDPAEIVEWCTSRMAHFKIPRYFEFVDTFPRSTTKQEVLRGELKKLPNDRSYDREKELGRLSGQSSAADR